MKLKSGVLAAVLAAALGLCAAEALVGKPGFGAENKATNMKMSASATAPAEKAMSMSLIPQAMADEAPGAVALPDAGEVPAYLPQILSFLKSIPYVGPVVSKVLAVVSVVCTVATALYIFLLTLFSIPEVLARWAGAQKIADFIKKYGGVVLKWLKYLSIFNAQKKAE
jgi:hypothetical protein